MNKKEIALANLAKIKHRTGRPKLAIPSVTVAMRMSPTLYDKIMTLPGLTFSEKLRNLIIQFFKL